MRQTLLALSAVIGLLGTAQAQETSETTREVDVPDLVITPVAHELDGVAFESTLIYLPGEARPSIVMVPNWMGPDETNLLIAKRIAEEYGLVVLLADVYGATVRPKNADEAKAAATALRSDRPLLRRRVAQAVEVLKTQADAPVMPDQLAAIGFCFGGGAVLELARSGTDAVRGVVSFHGNLDTPNADDAKKIQTKILVQHGNDDPLVPDSQVADFFSEMRAAKVDYQFIAYGNAVHSFTDPTASMAGTADYNELVAERAFGAMDAFFMEIFNEDDGNEGGEESPKAAE